MNPPTGRQISHLLRKSALIFRRKMRFYYDAENLERRCWKEFEFTSVFFLSTIEELTFYIFAHIEHRKKLDLEMNWDVWKTILKFHHHDTLGHYPTELQFEYDFTNSVFKNLNLSKTGIIYQPQLSAIHWVVECTSNIASLTILTAALGHTENPRISQIQPPFIVRTPYTLESLLPSGSYTDGFWKRRLDHDVLWSTSYSTISQCALSSTCPLKSLWTECST